MKVIKRETATHTTPIGGSEPVPLTGVDRLELEGGMVVYQDVSQPDCFYTNDDPISVRGHMSSHTKAIKRVAREAEAAKADRSAKAADASAAGREANAARLKLIEETGGPAAFLRSLADGCEDQAKYLRQVARLIEQAEKEGVSIAPERLAQLEDAEQRWQGVLAAAGVAPRQSRRSR